MSSSLLFQYCQKIVVFSADMKSVLLACRKGEADYDGTYSFIGGKMETTDDGFMGGLKREKDEEVGGQVVLRINPDLSYNELYVKKDGNSMVLPHYFAIFVSGDITLSDEYSSYKWVNLSELDDFQPVIATVPTVVNKMVGSLEVFNDESVLVTV